MKTIDVIRNCRGSVGKENFTLLSKMNIRNWSYVDFAKYMKENNIDIEKIYYEKGDIQSDYWYIDYDLSVYIQLYDLSKDVFEMFQIKKNIKVIQDKQKENLLNKNYEIMAVYIPEKFRIIDFEHNYKNYPKEKIFDLFSDAYTSVDFGFSYWNKEILEDVFSLVEREDSNEEITIYRGVASKSTPLKETYSWTTDWSIAFKFATMYDIEESIIYKAKIRKRDIIGYLDNRNEAEVICRFKDLYNVEKGEELPPGVIKVLLDENRDEYSELANKVESLLFQDLSSHDYSHTLRVLFWCIILAKELTLSNKEKKILFQAAMLHDIGRINDLEDDKHGLLSCNKIDEETINPLHLNSNGMEIMKILIQHHCLPDKIGLCAIKKKNFINQEQIIKLYNILKDADALDRVRIRDLDIHYLRIEKSKKYPLTAMALFKKYKM